MKRKGFELRAALNDEQYSRKSPLLLVEYCEKGDLLHYIREKKEEIVSVSSFSLIYLQHHDQKFVYLEQDQMLYPIVNCNHAQ